jgi:hypothetical protein
MRSALIPLSLAIALAACSTPTPTYNFQTTHQVIDASGFAKLQGPTRYYLDDSKASLPDLPTSQSDPSAADTAKRDVRTAFERELAARGWMPAPRDTADVIVSYRFETRSGTSTFSTGQFSGSLFRRYSTTSPPEEVAYREQAILMDVGRPSGAAIWRGQVGGRLYSAAGDARPEMIDQAVARLVGELGK